MSKKPAALSADLVAIKGAAKPSPDMPSRASTADEEGTFMATRAEGEVEGRFTPLNFRVTATFRREFKTYAAQHDLKLNELLKRSFEAYRRQQSE